MLSHAAVGAVGANEEVSLCCRAVFKLNGVARIRVVEVLGVLVPLHGDVG